MTRPDVIELLPDETARGVFDTAPEEGRLVYVEVRSVGMRESYEARAHDLNPEVVFILSEYSEYQNEPRCRWNDVEYNIVRTYVNGLRLELTCERRSPR